MMSMWWYLLLVLFYLVIPYFGQNDYCREGRYGNKCQWNCPEQCRPLQTFPCNKNTGRCSEGCNNGYYGDKCDKRCFCPSGICYQANGECYETDTTTDRTIQTTTNRVEKSTKVPVLNPDCEGVEDGYARCIIAIGPIISIILLACGGVLTFLMLRFRRMKNRAKFRKGEEVSFLPAEQHEEATGGQNEPITSLDDSPGKKQPWSKPHGEIDEKDKKIKQLKREIRSVEDKCKNLERTLSRHEYRENEIHTLLGLPSSSTNSKFSTNHLMSNIGLNKASWLHCPPLKFDTETVNGKVARIDDNMVLKNSPDPRPTRNTRKRFQRFQGTTSTEPLFKIGLSQYFEVVFDIDVKHPVGEGEVVMQLGFCREEDRDQNPFIEYKKNNCFVVKAVSWKNHQKICLESTKDGKKKHMHELMNNVRGARTKVNIGIRLDKDMMEIGVFDCLKDKLLLVSDINIGEKIWPMFGVCAGSEASVTIQLISGRDIEMWKNKKEVIKTKF